MIGRHDDVEDLHEPRWDASIDFALERQNGLHWCWAAVAKGIVEHYGGPRQKQCQYATKFLGQKRSCCRTGRPPARCEVACDLDSVFVHYGVYAPPPYHRPVGLATLRRELERDRPVVALMAFPASVHALVVTAVDVANRRLGFADPQFGRGELDADTFACAYREEARWCYTILTRPRASAARRATISFLYGRMRHDDSEPSPIRGRRSDTLPVHLYEADPYRLADGTGLQTAQPRSSKEVRLDVVGGYDGALWLDRELTPLREEIEARRERGFEVRLVRCSPYQLEALWFTDPSDGSHRTDHYIPVGPVPYYLDAGREYSPAELRDELVKIAPVVLRGIEANRRWLERLDRETANQVDDPTI